MTADLSLFLSEVRRDRLRAIRELELVDDTVAFALRRLLYTDRDSHVRAAAARTLGTFPAAEPWLLESLHDRSPLVRDSILRSLSRIGTAPSRPPLRVLVERDPIWWVRRSAVYSLAAIAGEADVPAFTAALADPFWRVRHAAVRVLAMLGARDPEVRDAVLDAPPSTHAGTLTFLHSSWGPAALDAPTRATSTSALPSALLDADPAVVTARVPHDPDVTPIALVELLCDPHAALREAVIERLTRSGSIDAFTAALDWLEEPRIPNVVDAVHDLLDRLGEPAYAVAERALARTDRPAGAQWAIEWVVAAEADTLYDAALDRARTGSTSLRRAALAIAELGDLAAWTRDVALLDEIAVELHARRAYTELAAIDGSSHPRTRALQVDAAARRRDPDWPFVEGALTDPHSGPRAIAARWLVRSGRLDAIDVVDDDPTVREAALHAGASIDAAVAALADDDPWVCRAAIRALVLATRGAEMLPEHAIVAALATLDSPDRGSRITACELPLADDRLLARVVALTGERDDGLRAAATQALEHLPDSDIRLRALVGLPLLGVSLDASPASSLGASPTMSLGASPASTFGASPASTFGASPATPLAASTRALAYAWLLRRLDDEALAHARLAYDRETDAWVRELLLGIIAAITTTRAAMPTATPATITPTTITPATATPPTATPTTATPTTATTTPVPDVLISPISPSSANRGSTIATTVTTTPVPDGLISPISPDAPAPTNRVGTTQPTVQKRAFGRAGFDVAPLAISGAFDLPAPSLEAAERAGVDLFFWETGYDVLARFLRTRPHLRVVSGTYHADAASIRRDVDHALKTLRRDTLDAFLLFWTRSSARVDAAAFAALDALKRAGKIRAAGFSTHHRDLARDAIVARPWDVVMIRHSAAHPGIETELLPTARERGTAILTFSALTYGRMTAGDNAPKPVECYQYSLAQPGVTACISAPRRFEELADNLGALASPTLSAERIAEMRTHGIGVRAESQRFNTLLRQPTRDAAAAAREMLASEQAPNEVRVPSPNAARRSRTRLGGRRRR